MAPNIEGNRLRWGLLAAVLLVLSVPVLATVALAVFVDEAEMTAWLEPRLSGALNREVSLGGAGVAILPRPGVQLVDVRVGGAEGSEVPAVIAVRHAHLGVAYLPLLVGRVHAKKIRLTGLDVRLAIDEDGVSNFGDLVPESSVVEVSMQGPVGFAVDEVEIDDASLTYFDGVRNRSFAVSGAEGDLVIGAARDGRWTARVTGDADSLYLRLPSVSEEVLRADAPELSLTAVGDGSFGWIEIEEGTLSQWGETLSVRGRIEGLSDVDPTLALRFENPSLQLTRFAGLVPAETRARVVPAFEGSIAVGLSLSGSLKGEGTPFLTGSVGLSGVGLRLGGEPVLTDVSGRIGVRPGTFALDSLVGTFADGPFLLAGEVDRTGHAVDVSFIASPELGAFQRLGLAPFDAALGGDAEMVVDVAGPWARPDSMRVDGTVRAAGVRLEHPRVGVPIYAPSLTLELEGTELRWNEADVLVGTDPTTTTGRIDGWIAAAMSPAAVPAVEASLRGSEVSLDSIFPGSDEGPDVTYARLALAHLGGREVAGRDVRELVDEADYVRPRSLPFHGTVDVAFDRLRYGTYDLVDVSARLVFSDSALHVEDAGFISWGGAVETRLLLGVGDRVDEPFSLVMTVAEADAVPLLVQLTPVGESMTGRLTMELSVEGSLDREAMPVLSSLRGDARLAIEDGEVFGTGLNHALADFLGEERWRSVPYASWTTDLEIDEGMLNVVSSELEGPRASATLTGVVGLGGAVDLAMALSIPADQFEAVSLRRTGVAQSVLDRLLETGSSLDLGIRISGTLAGPTLEPDALAASDQVVARER